MDIMNETRNLLIELEGVLAVKFGNFELKSGIESPVYFDLRVIVSHPKIMNDIAKLMWKICSSVDSFDLICGVPYTALPIATLMSVHHDIPMILRRKEIKQYGTKKILEGNFVEGQACLIIEDVVTSGSSVIETAEILRDHNIVVKDAIVLLDREQGGKENLAKYGITLHTVCGVGQLIDILFREGKVSLETCEQVKLFVSKNQIVLADPKVNTIFSFPMSYSDRFKSLSRSSPLKRLLSIIETKQSNLCVAADVNKMADLEDVATKTGPHICCLKTHVDTLEDWDHTNGPLIMRQLATKHNFLIIEDKKFCDIGNTVKDQFRGGLYSISSWADLVTVHAISGPGVINAIKAVSDANVGVLLISQMSSKGNLIDDDYTYKCVNMAMENIPLVLGLICQKRLSDNPNIMHFTPGVNMSSLNDDLGQKYTTPEEAILSRETDVVIVGRGITSADDMSETAEVYRKASWCAYENRLKQND